VKEGLVSDGFGWYKKGIKYPFSKMRCTKEGEIILRGACGHVHLWVAAATGPCDGIILVVMYRFNQPLA